MVTAKLSALATRHEVVFLCSVDGAADQAALDELSRTCGLTALGIRAPNSRGRRARVVNKATVLSQAAKEGVPHRVYQAAHRPLRDSLQSLAQSRDFDLVQLDYWHLGLEWIAECPVPSICYVHDLLYERLGRRVVSRRSSQMPGRTAGALDRRLFLRGLRDTELATLSGFTALAAISPRDADQLLVSLPGHRVEALPVGVDTATLHFIEEMARDPQIVLFVGAFRRVAQTRTRFIRS